MVARSINVLVSTVCVIIFIKYEVSSYFPGKAEEKGYYKKLPKKIMFANKKEKKGSRPSISLRIQSNSPSYFSCWKPDLRAENSCMALNELDLHRHEVRERDWRSRWRRCFRHYRLFTAGAYVESYSNSSLEEQVLISGQLLYGGVLLLIHTNERLCMLRKRLLLEDGAYANKCSWRREQKVSTRRETPAAIDPVAGPKHSRALKWLQQWAFE